MDLSFLLMTADIPNEAEGPPIIRNSQIVTSDEAVRRAFKMIKGCLVVDFPNRYGIFGTERWSWVSVTEKQPA